MMDSGFSATQAALSFVALLKHHRRFVLRYVILTTILSVLAIGVLVWSGLPPAIMALQEALTKNTDIVAAAESMSGKVNNLYLGIGMLVVQGLSILVSAMALRKLVRNEESEGPFLGLAFGEAEKRFLVMSIKIGLVMVLAMLVSIVAISLLAKVLGPASSILSIPISFGVLYLSARLGLWGVLTIAGEADVIKKTWDLTGPHWLKILATYSFVLIMTVLASWIVTPISQILAGLLGTNISAGMPATLIEMARPGWLVYFLITGIFGAISGLAILSAGAYIYHAIKPKPVANTLDIIA